MTDSELLGYCRRHQEILCYGAGVYGRIVRIYLFEHDIDITAFLVSERKTGQEEILEKKVYAITEHSYQEGQGILLCANSSIIPDMEKLLRRQGITDYIIVDRGLINNLDQHNHYNHVFRTKGVQTLLYHRVAELENDIWKLAVSPDTFEKQINYLKENYNIIRFEDDWAGDIENGVAITFDDGYYDNYKYALPILEQCEVPATIFVCTGNIDTDKEFWWDELENIIICDDNLPSEISLFGERIQLDNRTDKITLCYRIRKAILEMQPDEREVFLLNLKRQVQSSVLPREGYRTINRTELKILDRSPFITIGGHTVTHSRLASESREMQAWEIDESKLILEELLGHAITVFSYPFGMTEDYDKTAIDIALKAQYNKIAAVAMRYGDSEMYNLNIPRLCVQQTEREDNNRSIRRLLCLNGNL